MFNLLGKLWTLLTGIFIRTGDQMVASSPERIRAIYAAAIMGAKGRYKDMQQALALMMGTQKRLEKTCAELENQKALLNQKLQGAIRMAQTEPTNELHKQVGAKYLTSIQDIEQRLAKVKIELTSYDGALENYNTQLVTTRDEVDRLKQEEITTISDFISSKQRVQLEERMAGLSTTSSTDESLVAIREQVERMKNEADIVSKIRVNGETDVYAQVGAEQNAVARFEELLKTSTAQAEGMSSKVRDLG